MALKIYRMLSAKYGQQTENTLEGAIQTAQNLANSYNEPILISVGTQIPGTWYFTWEHIQTINPTNQNSND